MKYIVTILLAVAAGFSLAAVAQTEPVAQEKLTEWTYEAKMPMHVVYPRPDCETKAYSRHKWAHTDMPYEIPVGIQGGAWPFTYKLIEGPEGATIGENYGEEKYGIVTWQPKATDKGKQVFRIRVRDKVGNNLDLEWSTVVDNDQFVFVEDGYTGARKGTIESPLEDISDWYRDNKKDDTYHNKIVVFRKGNYKLIGGEDTYNNLRMNSNSKPKALIGFPGEIAEIDASSAKIVTDFETLTDFFVADLTFKNSRQDINNAHFFWAIGDVSRSTWWRNRFLNHKKGKRGDDNPAGVFLSDRKKHKKNILYKDNFHDGFYNGRGNGSYVDIYYASYVLIEGNYAQNSDNACGFLAKGTTGYVTIRDNHAYKNIGSGGICIGYGLESPEIPHDHEVAWNRIVLKPGDKSVNSLLFSMQNSRWGEFYNSYIYRNTFVNGAAWIRFKGKEKYLADGNVVVNTVNEKWNKDIIKTMQENLVGSPSDFITNSEGELAGYAKELYMGKVGYQQAK